MPVKSEVDDIYKFIDNEYEEFYSLLDNSNEEWNEYAKQRLRTLINITTIVKFYQKNKPKDIEIEFERYKYTE